MDQFFIVSVATVAEKYFCHIKYFLCCVNCPNKFHSGLSYLASCFSWKITHRGLFAPHRTEKYSQRISCLLEYLSNCHTSPGPNSPAASTGPMVQNDPQLSGVWKWGEGMIVYTISSPSQNRPIDQMTSLWQSWSHSSCTIALMSIACIKRSRMKTREQWGL